METFKKHITHYKTTMFVGGVLFTTAVISFGIGFYHQEITKDIAVSHQYGCIFAITAPLTGLWFIFRTFFCKCPTCEQWLTKQHSREYKKPRKFIYKKCNIIWDTGVIVEFDN